MINSRHVHNVVFEKSDLFFIYMLKPLSAIITVDDLQIEGAKWMPLDYQRYCGLSTHQVVSKFDGKITSLYYNVFDNDDSNCVGK